jgi:microcystin-dependent protein
MPLSRLENFLKNAEGNILYVNPSDFDATDSFENQGNSLTRPFKTIQRALIEAARFSYQRGENNDKIDRTTILVYPGTHYIDNRPGYSIEEIDGAAVYKRRTAPDTWEETTITEFNEVTNFDILNPNNDLFKYNSISGGAILPRGTSIIGLDLRKTKIRPLYVPDPEDDNIEATSILNVTGTCYFTAFSIFDADPSKTVYKDYSGTQVAPNYSHHKVTCFEYGDGVNMVALANYQTYLSDLDMYYFKVAKAYGDITGRGLGDYPVNEDFEPSVDEFRIVGSLDANPLGISSIKAGNGNGTGDLNEITVTTSNKLTGDTFPHNLYVDSPFLVSGVTVDGESYNGSFTVSDVVGVSTFKYIANQTPLDFLPAVGFFDTATVTVGSDTVSSASPYIFNCSLRSVFGMNGMHADGSKATGFKSMVTAQFTGVSLQKDNNAFILYDEGTFYEENTLPTNSLSKPLHTNSRAIFKPGWENFHVKCSNNAFIQCVSIFAIGFAKHFVAETGGDQSITNSNSNFGNTSLEAVSFKPESFDRDDVGYITHIIPPRGLVGEENSVNWLSLDVEKTINSVDTSRLYIFDQNNEDTIPPYQIDGFRIGARDNDILNLTITVGTAQTTYTAPILMPVPFGERASARKEYEVSRTNGQNLISNNIINLTETHQFLNGERVRVFSDTANTPDGLDNEGIYYAITGGGLSPNQLKLAQSLNDAVSDTPVLGINNNGGILKIVSRVSDKIPGQLGHPIQWDTVENNWYLISSNDGSINEIYTAIVTTGSVTLGEESSAAFFRRQADNRSIDDKVYRLRYVIPKEYDNAKPPEAGYVVQESKTVGITSVSFTNDVLTSTKDLRNERVIVDAISAPVIAGSQVITITTELPHGFIEGDEVKLQKIRSANNPLSVGIVSTFNGIYTVTNIINSKQFQYITDGVKVEPGTFTNDIDLRNTRQQREALPVVSRDEYKESYFIYRVNQVKKHVPGDDGQDGVYHLICLNSSVSPVSTVGYNLYEKQFSQDVRNLYPQQDRDNLNTNPKSAVSYADLKVIGDVITDDKRHSVTREGVDYFIKGTKVGYAVTQLDLSGVNNSNITVYTDVEHNLNSIKTLTFLPGSGYQPSATLYSVKLAAISSNGEGATVKVTTDATGSISNIQLLDYGSAYTVGDTLSVPGGVINSTVTVTAINDNSNDSIEVNGFYVNDLNNSFEISNIPSAKIIELSAPLGISTNDPNSSGELGYVIPSGNVSSVSSLELSDIKSGITTITTSNSHGLFSGNDINIVGTGLSAFDSNFIIKDIVGLTTFTVQLLGAGSTATSSTGKVVRKIFAANGKILGRGEENIASRAVTIYDKKTNYVDTSFNNAGTTISFSDPDSIVRGEYYQINNEIVRISGSSNPFTVLRGQFGTFKTTALANTLARKVAPIPSELRRPSFMRASGHTFEYLGFGPGNYSTGMPQKQNRILSEQEVLKSQSKEQRGGSVVYTGMNDLGEFFSGSKKLSSATGEESVVDAPVITYTGDDAEGENNNLSSGIFDELLVRRRITVEGGENTNQTSQFYGPVNFTNKVTNTSELGIETKNLYIKGNVTQAKLITVGIATPTFSAKAPGDISLISNPTDGYAGYIYIDSQWKPWGFISEKADEKTLMIDHLGIGNVNTPENLVRLNVSDQTILENVQITGALTLDQPQSLGDVTFDDILVRGTGRFSNEAIDDLGNLRYRTILCEGGTQEFHNVEVTGFSTFTSRVDFISNVYGIGGRFGNINIGIFNDNAITKLSGSGALVLDSDPNDRNGVVRIEDNLQILSNINANVYQTWGVRDDLGIGTAISAKLEIKTINVGTDSANFDLGIGNTSGSAKLALHTRDDIYSDGTFTIDAFSNGDARVAKRGENTTLTVEALDSGADIKFTVGTNQNFHITPLGHFHFEQNNSGTELAGNHLKIDQKGNGDAVLSWHRSKNNGNIRWYSGIDASDGNSWKLANPSTTTAAGSEDFDRASETKLKIDTSGNTSILGDLDVGGNDITTPTTGVFNLLNSSVTTLNAFQDATSINIGNSTSSSFVLLRGTRESTSCTTGALRVAGGVGIAKNLYVCGKIGPAVFNSTVTIEGELTLKDNVTIDGTTVFGKTTNNTLCNVNTGAVQFDGGVGIAKNVSIGQGLCVNSDSEFKNDLNARRFIKTNGGITNGQSNFLRADGSDTIIQLQDLVNTLTYVPQPPITLTAYPKGNSFRLLSIASQFNGSKKTFNLFSPDSVAFTPEGAANLLVYLNDDTLLEPDADYIIPIQSTSPLTYQSKIQFIRAPLAGQSCHIVALGGQGMVLDDEGWTAKGQLAVGKEQNRAEMLDVGTNDQVLVANSSKTLGVEWMWMQQEPPIGSVHYFAASTAPEGYLVCNGGVVNSGVRSIQGKTADYTYLHNLLDKTFGSTKGTLPNLMNRVPMGGAGGSNYDVGETGGANTHSMSLRDIPAHTHTLTQNGKHSHNVNLNSNGYHDHNNDASGKHDHNNTNSRITQHTGHNHGVQLGPVDNHDHTSATGSSGYHKHNFQTQENGQHIHTGEIGDAAAHDHPVAASIGNHDGHQHQLQMNSNGYHRHPGTAAADGLHNHQATVNNHTHGGIEKVNGQGGDGDRERSGDFSKHSTAENKPGVTLGQEGSHGHQLTIEQNGKHNHGGSTTQNGSHTHPLAVEVQPTSAHDHPITLSKHDGHSHGGSTSEKAKHAHEIGGDGGHGHPANTETGGTHTHQLQIQQDAQHTHNINEEGKHNHTTTVSTYDVHNHQIGQSGGDADGGQTQVDLRNPYLGLLPVIKAYYVGPKTTKNW